MAFLRPAQVRNLKLVVWTAVVAGAFWALARYGPDLPEWVFWVSGLVVWMVGNVAILVGETQLWRRMAEALDLAPARPVESAIQWLGMPDLVGTFGGREVAVRTFRTGGEGGGRTQDWTVVETRLAGPTSAPLDVRGRRWTFGAKAPAGASAIVTHDPAFEDVARAESPDPRFGAQVLTPQVRDRFVALDVPFHTVVEDAAVVHRVRTRLLEPHRVRGHLEAVVALADEVERATR